MAPDRMPDGYQMRRDGGGDAPEEWWKSFGSEELNELVDTALGDNFSIRIAWAKLRQARASAGKAGAALWPSLNLTGEAEHTRKSSKTPVTKFSKGGSVETGEDSYTIGVAASYELDLWGRVRSAREAEKLSARATRADLDAAAVSVAASVAENWINLIAAREQIRLLEEQVKINQSLLQLQQVRFENSLATGLDVLQQREVLARTQALLPSLLARKQTLSHSLDLLLGLPPGSGPPVTGKDLPEPAPLPEPGLPADLLAMRPDVRAAGLRLMAADWSVSSARADRLPTITLTGRFQYSGAQLNVLFDNWILNLAAGLTGPIFDAGRRKAEVERVRGVVDERLANYQKTVYTAVGEVEDALVNERRQAEQVEAMEKQLQAAQMAYNEARNRYMSGSDNFINMLSELTSVQSLQREMILERANLLKYRVALHRALGGAWPENLTPSGLNAENNEKKADVDPKSIEN